MTTRMTVLPLEGLGAGCLLLLHLDAISHSISKDSIIIHRMESKRFKGAASVSDDQPSKYLDIGLP
jgi:hypothetical protein